MHSKKLSCRMETKLKTRLSKRDTDVDKLAINKGQRLFRLQRLE